MASILVPVDFSDCAPNVIREAARFARAFNAKLLLLHASEVPRGMPLSSMIEPPGERGPRTVEALLREDAEAHLAPLLQQARELQIQAETKIVFGRPADVILDVARLSRAEMIVMGTHGRTGLARVTLGSIAEDVVRRAEVPVVTLRTKHHAGCEASSCATCSLGHGRIEELLGAEDAG